MIKNRISHSVDNLKIKFSIDDLQKAITKIDLNKDIDCICFSLNKEDRISFLAGIIDYDFTLMVSENIILKNKNKNFLTKLKYIFQIHPCFIFNMFQNKNTFFQFTNSI